MKTSTVVIGALVLGIGGVAVYYFTRPKPQTPQQAQTNASGNTGFVPPAQGGNSTLNTVSQVVGVGEQASKILGNLGVDFGS